MLAPRPRPDARPAVLIAAIGPYTAPLTELVWALHRQRNMAVVEAFVVVDRRGFEYVPDANKGYYEPVHELWAS